MSGFADVGSLRSGSVPTTRADPFSGSRLVQAGLRTCYLGGMALLAIYGSHGHGAAGAGAVSCTAPSRNGSPSVRKLLSVTKNPVRDRIPVHNKVPVTNQIPVQCETVQDEIDKQMCLSLCLLVESLC
jgi:hypothetical protein